MSTTKVGSSRKVRSRLASDDYLELVKQFPLRPLRSAAEVKSAGRILDRLVGRDDLTPGQRDYLAALAHFVHDEQQRAVRRRRGRLGPVDLLKHLMRENGMNTTDLGLVLGSRGLASEVLNRKRGLSKTLIAKLARYFGVDPALFLDIDEPG